MSFLPSREILTNIVNGPETDLCRIMNKHLSDKGSGHHNYTKLYHQLFKESRFRHLNVLEIGIGSVNPSILSNMSGTPEQNGQAYLPGASARGWNEYFPNSQIFVCDIDEDILEFKEERITGFHLDQTNEISIIDVFHNKLSNLTFDIIIDDGLHHFPTNWKLMNLIHGKLTKGGIYIIEDIVDYNPELVKGTTYTRSGFIQIPNPQNDADNNLYISKA